MAIVVQKYGGTSVGTIERIKHVAEKVAKCYQEGNNVAVVLSAMAGQTDKLINMAKEIAEFPDPRELDVLVATGEQITVALLAMILKEKGIPAKSLLAHQIGIKTDNAHTKARIQAIGINVLQQSFQNREIAVVAGFQGVTEDNNITTLGRGGSDTSAVALAAVLNADVCEIYTDVDGVYTCDPNICAKARRINRISYDEMLEMASLGAKVLQTRSVEFAKKYNVPIMVKSTFTDEGGTLVTKEDNTMEKEIVSGITYDKNEAKISLLGIPDKPGVAAEIFTELSRENINVDMIIQNMSTDGNSADMSFTVTRSDYKKAMEIIGRKGEKLGAREVVGDTSIVKLSIVGVGMRSHAGVASRMFTALSGVGINIMMISTSEIKVSCVIDEKFLELGVRVLHDTFELETPGGNVEKN